jgi:outer membrane protein OmpA-like peptidoglycan-associated protein/tetratricopeptide (TPR) repeat protein
MEANFKNKSWLIAAFVLICATVVAQSEIEKGDKAYHSMKYQNAIEYYVSYLAKKNDPVVATRLAEAYFLSGRYMEAEERLKLLSTEIQENGTILLKYANVLLINGKTSDAKIALASYIKNNPSNSEYKRLFDTVNFEPSAKEEKYTVKIDMVKFSSDVSDFAPMYYENKLIFTSQKGGKKDPWTGRSFSNIHITNVEKSAATQLQGNLNGKFHNGAITFADQDMIFTRNNSKKGNNEDYNLILATAKKNGEAWNFDSEFIFNDRNYSNAYPTYFSKDKVLIFSSDKVGGFGGMDLYYSKKVGGTWTTPINLGSKINTSGDEVFSYAFNEYLYFASNGYPGLGGLDIYKTKLLNNQPGEIVHLDAPINSNRDDFAFITQDTEETNGYFSSNRGGEGSIDKIYSFTKELIPQPEKSISISGKVVDEYTKMPLKETEVTLYDLTNNTKQIFSTGEDGRFIFEAVEKHNYRLSGIKNNIKTTEESIININHKDAYYYTLLHNDPRFSLEGFAINNNTKLGVSGVKVIKFNKSKNTEESTITDDKGFFKFQLDQNSDFEISGTKDGYYTSVSDASTKGLNRSTVLYVKLFLSIEEVIIGETRILGKETFGGFEFEPVYYDLDKANIRVDAANSLDKVVDFMQKNPKLQIELGSHTDSRSSNKYNLDLSDRRAVSAVDYIVSKGIDSSRIIGKGYGESNLVNSCSDGVKCSETQHQENRRTEIKVIGLNQ